MTAEQLLIKQPPNMRSELVNGRMLIREPAFYEHGTLAMLIGFALRVHENRVAAIPRVEHRGQQGIE